MVSFCFLCLLFISGIYLRKQFFFFERFYIPASIIAGILGLLIISLDQYYTQTIPHSFTYGWKKLPSILINIVFGALFIGKSLPSFSDIWKNCSRQLAYGQIVAWGQYFVGCFIVLFLLKPLFGIPDVFAGVMPVGFEGGHGTAAGMTDVFNSLGFSELTDLTLASATVGILFSIIIGMVLINWAIKKKYVDNQVECNNNNYLTNEIKTFNFNSLVINLIIIGIAVLIGFLIKNVLLAAADLFSKDVSILLKSFPTFPLCMIGGFIVQKFSEKMKTSKLIEYNQIQRIQNIALDVLILAAISTISLDVVNSNLLAFCILVLGGVVWNIFCVLVLARRIFNDAWFERSIAEMGQSMGVTATGLLLLRTVDPNCKTKAASAFASKQLLHEPFMGGGLWTGMAIPMLVIYGGWQVFIITIIVITAWLLYLIFSEKN